MGGKSLDIKKEQVEKIFSYIKALLELQWNKK